MANAPRDENHLPTLLGVSSADGITPVVLWADPTTHRLLVDLPAGTGDVTGDSASEDKEFVRFNSTTGKIIESPSADNAAVTMTVSDNLDVTWYEATNDGSPVFSYGSSATNRLTITPTYGSGAQTLEYVEFGTKSSSATADFGEYRFSVDEALIATIDDGGMELADSMAYFIDTSNVLSETTLGSSVLASSLTSVGTLTTLTVDDITINANTIISAGASDFDIDPAAGQSVVIDGALDIDGPIMGYTGVFTNTGDLIVLGGDVVIGATSADDTQPSLKIIGDADSDGAGDTDETLELTLTAAADPTAATWDFTSTQSAGYTFDKALTATTGIFTAASSLTLGTASSAAGAIILKNATNANTTTIQSGVAGASITFTLPTDDGDNEDFLQTNGSGVLAWAAGGGGSADAQEFTGDGTWTKPAGVTFVKVIVIGGGGGGGGGVGGSAGATRNGAGGGGAGAWNEKVFLAADLGATESVTIGASGAGGAGGSAANGLVGTSGGDSDFGSILFAFGGGGGALGSSSLNNAGGGGGGTGGAGGVGVSATGGVGGTPHYNAAPTSDANGGTGAIGGAGSNVPGSNAEYGGGGGGSPLFDGAGTAGGSAIHGGGGGGSGGGLGAGNTETEGGDGGATNNYTIGGGGAKGAVNGGAGTAGTAGTDSAGTGGGGGGAQDSGTGGVGGAGGTSGGGGGGGGGGTTTGGAGGAGGRGEVRIYSW